MFETDGILFPRGAFLYQEQSVDTASELTLMSFDSVVVIVAIAAGIASISGFGIGGLLTHRWHLNSE
jgi:hypothetical protein